MICRKSFRYLTIGGRSMAFWLMLALIGGGALILVTALTNTDSAASTFQRGMVVSPEAPLSVFPKISSKVPAVKAGFQHHQSIGTSSWEPSLTVNFMPVSIPVPVDESQVGIEFDVIAQQQAQVTVGSATVNVGNMFLLPITINPAGNEVDAAEVHLTFNTTYLTVCDASGNPTSSIVISGPLTNSLRNQVNNATGTIDYMGGLPPGGGGTPPTSAFTLAQIRFCAKAVTTGTPVNLNSAIVARNGMPYSLGLNSGNVAILEPLPPTETPTHTPSHTATPTPTATSCPHTFTGNVYEGSPGSTTPSSGTRVRVYGSASIGDLGTLLAETTSSLSTGAFSLTVTRNHAYYHLVNYHVGYDPIAAQSGSGGTVRSATWIAFADPGCRSVSGSNYFWELAQPTATTTCTATGTPTHTPTPTATVTRLSTATPVVVSTVIVPGQNGELISAGGNVLVHVPGECITERITLSIEDSPEPSQPFAGQNAWANYSFLLWAEDESGQPLTQFVCPIMIQVMYEELMWESAGVIAENLLKLYFWNGEMWVQLYPCNGCSIDTVNNVITVWVNHLTEFALAGPTIHTTCLPMLMSL
jgi:hypothetical protein